MSEQQNGHSLERPEEKHKLASINGRSHQATTQDTDVALGFLKGHTVGWQANGWFVQIVAIEPKRDKEHSPGIQATSVLPDEIDTLKTWLEAQHTKEWNIYFAVNPLASRLNSKANKYNIAALAYLHVDNDPQDGVPLHEERARLLTDAKLFLVKPTELVDSGNGLGLFWRLDKPIPVDGNVSELESTNERLKDHFKADHCHNIDRIMRLPGTINWPDYRKTAKGRVPVAAQLLDRNDEAYTLKSFDFLPAVAVKTKASTVVGSAETSGVVRFDQMLAGDDALRKRWEGDTTGLKDTSRSGLDMSLVSLAVIRGFNDAEITTILHAFKHGKAAQDKRGDDYIKPMLAKTRKKHVLTRNLSWTAYRLAAEHFTTEDGTWRLRHWRDDFYLWHCDAYQRATTDDIDACIQNYLEGAYCLKAKGKHESYNPTPHGIGQVREILGGIVHVGDGYGMPCWLEQRDSDPKPGELLVMANGLLHLPTRTLHAHCPRLFTTTALPYPYDPQAKFPMAWHDFMRTLWSDDKESIETLQEWAGYTLEPEPSQQKILGLIGPPRGGKGVITRVLQAMLGETNCIGPTLSSLGRNFGMQPLIDKTLAVISDARFKFGSDVVTERLLSISGQDEMTIDRKYKEPWTGRLKARFMLCSNELPNLEDASGALASRFILLQLTESWLDREDTELPGRLMQELPGIFNWALEGLDRLHKRGFFRQPTTAKKLIEEFKELTSPVKAFLRDECVIGADLRTECNQFYLHWQMWCLHNGRKEVGTKQQFGRDIRAVMPTLDTKQFRVNGKPKYFYVGIGIANAHTTEEFQRVLDQKERARKAKLLL